MKALLLAVFLTFLAIGSSIKCYQCTNCTTEKGELKECENDDDNACKTTNITKSSLVTKECSDKEACKTACDVIKEGETGTCQCCEEDGCNGGVSFTIPTITMILPAVLAITYYC